MEKLGVIVRNLLTGEFNRHFGHAVVLATGGYGNVYYLSTNAMGNVTAAWKAYKNGAAFSNPCFTQIHPRAYLFQVNINQSSLMSESCVMMEEFGFQKKGDNRYSQIPEQERDYLKEGTTHLVT